MRLRLARGCWHWVAVPAVLAVLSYFFVHVAVVAVFAASAAALAWFFRDPERPVGEGIVSPADGRVTVVEETEEGTRVSIFMSPYDCHVNRAPLSGHVASVRHFPGSFKPAFRKDADGNERVETLLETRLGPVRVVQIAGILARRIVPYVKEGQDLEKGDRMGIIRLGSRVDVHLPPAADVIVRPGQRVKAAATTVARGPKV